MARAEAGLAPVPAAAAPAAAARQVTAEVAERPGAVRVPAGRPAAGIAGDLPPPVPRARFAGGRAETGFPTGAPL